ncbi:substrate-binding domain-containing protein [Polyangium sorediatum]|uniref:Substrate-binding domain-containing protein n=1 Tax=Polyangium sorediatum TaxID=889274 RepID=A0ABT6NYI7_9BACT|nr:substrate-binding domain-containing protein [Polyangium sorediatum]MDI1433374.1 substrate-binding domain-containing protein [Polyangium sorediatum]
MAKSSKQAKAATPAERSQSREALTLLVVLGLLGGVAYRFVRDQVGMSHAETKLIVDAKMTTSVKTELCGPPTKDGRPVVISMLSSDDKRAWVEQAADRYAKLCPNIQVQLSVMGDIESADAILAGEQQPTLWAPADELVVRYLDTRWRKEKNQDKPLFDVDQKRSLVESPLVVLIWEDRLQAVDAIMSARSSEQGPWVDLLCAFVPPQADPSGMATEDLIPGRWIDWYESILPAPPRKKTPAPAAPRRRAEETPEVPKNVYRAPFPTLDELRQWGVVKFGHTSPTRSASGLESLYLMAYDYVLPPKERPDAVAKAISDAQAQADRHGSVVSTDIAVPDFKRAFAKRKQALGRWLKRCEGGLDAAPNSAKLLAETMFNVGPSRYDAVVTYEHLTFPILDQIDGFVNVMHDMRVIYPTPTIMNQHPVVLLDGPASLTDPQRLAATKWIDFLHSEEMQKKAIDHGFRPANPVVSIRGYYSTTNPFLRLRRYGITFDTPIVEPPRVDGELVNELIRLWEDATGRN